MVDIVDAETRSHMMRNIRGKDTKPELLLRHALHARGFRYRLHHKQLPGRPDLVFPKYGAAVFVHGCFWHRHQGCPKATTPGTREEFWQEKFAKNIARDRRNLNQLQEAGWRVLVVWECELSRSSIDQTVNRVSRWLCSSYVTCDRAPQKS
ncbi:very short patch repair endonuclease [Ruegeria sp. R14_0]|uniref:very short patch repair endonuclease n=1 Tax=Ruegeria sp. R14_0 TaxID=2821100 RepID=UPI001ADAF478|nr:very short patch repair endonuclease [Ruegeria sp. R14_0]MBO9445732.1 DNA mismatch endonuclease Vsr [Ruegeria sp. R14_0]